MQPRSREFGPARTQLTDVGRIVQTLAALEHQALDCHDCRLAEGRTSVVFGAGAPDADLMFIGEAPGHNEDLQGLPFVGHAGKLLGTLLGEVGLARDEVYIANVLKCRPPGNRDPLPDEIESCTPYLREQVRAVDPRIIVTLGNFATRFVLRRTVGITRVRGQKFPIGSRIIIPTYHPAAVLRGGPNGRPMRETREDFRLVADTLAAMPRRRAVSVHQAELF